MSVSRSEGMTGRARKERTAKGSGIVAPRERAAALSKAPRWETVAADSVRHYAADRQRQLGQHFAVCDGHEPALHGRDPSHGCEHVAVVGADDDDVVGVVSIGGSERPTLQPEAA